MSAKHGGHQKKKKSPVGGILAAVLILALLGAGGFLGWKAYEKRNAVPPQEVLAAYLDSLGAMSAEELSAAAGVKTPATEDGRTLLRRGAELLSIAAAQSEIPSGDRAELPVEITTLDVGTLASPLNASVNASLAAAVEDARVASEVYDEDWQFRGELVHSVFSERLADAALEPAVCCRIVPLTALYFLFPQMDKVLWIICGMAGPFTYVLLVKDYREMLGMLLRRPRYWCGVVAQFFYVGVQIAVWTWINAYCQQEFGVKPDEAAFYYLASIFLFVAMRWVATALMRRVNPALLLAGFAFAAIVSTAGVMYLPSATLFTVMGHPVGLNALALVCVTGCMSLMFPTIYGMALGGLDPRAFRLGAAGLIMSILGGAIITPWMGAVAGSESSAWFALVPGFDAVRNLDLQVSCQSIRASFAVPAICFAVVLAYSLAFMKKTTKPNEKENRQ